MNQYFILFLQHNQLSSLLSILQLQIGVLLRMDLLSVSFRLDFPLVTFNLLLILLNFIFIDLDLHLSILLFIFFPLLFNTLLIILVTLHFQLQLLINSNLLFQQQLQLLNSLFSIDLWLVFYRFSHEPEPQSTYSLLFIELAR